MAPQTNMLRTVARRTSSVTLVCPKILPARRWQSSVPPGSGFDSLGYIRALAVRERFERPFVHLQLQRMALPRAAPEFEEFVKTFGKTEAIVHNMGDESSQVVFEDKEKTADYAAEMHGSIFPPGATIEQGGIPLLATAVLPSTSLPEGNHHYRGKRKLHLENMPSLVHPSEVSYHQVKEWIESRCGCKTDTLGLVLRGFGRSDFAEGEMPPAVKVMFDASSCEKHVFLAVGIIRMSVDDKRGDVIQRFNNLPPLDRTYPGAKEPAKLTRPQLSSRPRDYLLHQLGVCASLIPRYVRRSDINEAAVVDFVKQHLQIAPTKVIVHEFPFYPSQFPRDDGPPELYGPNSQGVTMLTSGWVSIQFESKQQRELAMKKWHIPSFAEELPGSTKILFLRSFRKWHEVNKPWMRWISREELDKVTSPHKFLRDNAESWNPREPAMEGDDDHTGVTEHLPPNDLKWNPKKKDRGKVGSSADK